MFIHFAKRVYESFFVNCYSSSSDVKLLIALILYYWLINGFLIAREVFADSFKEKHSKILTTILALLQLYCEFGNYSCHMILKRTKEENKGFRGIPRGNMFEYVSAANYFWELATWLTFAITVQTLCSFLFFFIAVGLLTKMAKPKHEGYIKYFGDKYPKSRKIIFPFIL